MSLGQEMATRQEDVGQTDEEARLLRAIRSLFLTSSPVEMNIT